MRASHSCPSPCSPSFANNQAPVQIPTPWSGFPHPRQNATVPSGRPVVRPVYTCPRFAPYRQANVFIHSRKPFPEEANVGYLKQRHGSQASAGWPLRSARKQDRPPNPLERRRMCSKSAAPPDYAKVREGIISIRAKSPIYHPSNRSLGRHSALLSCCRRGSSAARTAVKAAAAGGEINELNAAGPLCLGAVLVVR